MTNINSQYKTWKITLLIKIKRKLAIHHKIKTMQRDEKKRFSRTVDYYLRYRPGYPEALLPFMQQEMGLSPGAVIADIGAGTGKLTEVFLANGNRVFGVEPNEDMRLAAEALLAEYPNFQSVDASAEATALADRSVDFITAGTAFHWFDKAATRAEWQRILTPEGWVLLVWNYRANERSAFMQAYENFLLEYSSDYKKVKESYPDQAVFDRFFGESNWQRVRLDHQQVFDFQGLKGRYLSCSYALPENHPQFEAAMDALRVIFERFQQNSEITHWYDTVLIFGKLQQHQ